MPIYQYHNTKTGQIEEHFRSVARRDCVEPHLKRIAVPVRVGYLGGLTEPGTAEHQIPKALRQLEEQGNNWRKLERDTGFSRDKLRQVWNF